MPRTPIKAFLSKAKDALSRSIQSNGEHPASFVIGNQSADLDSITCALVYGHIRSSSSAAQKADKTIIPVTNIPSSELRLRPELTALLKHADLKPSDLITLDDLGKLHASLPPDKTEWTLVDHNVLLGELGEHYSDHVVGAIDHHDDEGTVPKNAEPRIIEKTGSCNSHVVNYCRETWNSLPSSQSNTGNDKVSEEEDAASNMDAQVAKLALGSILIDTVNMKAESKVTDHDYKAVQYLESKIKSWDGVFNRDEFFEEINNAKSDLDDLKLEEILRKDYKQWDEEKLTLGISSAVRSIEYLMKKKDKFVDALIDFAKERKVDLYSVMCAHNESEGFQRQLLLTAMEKGKPVEVAEKFVKDNSKELQLENSGTRLDDSSAEWLHLWEQKNLAASRKRVAPMLREAMHE